MNRYIDVDEVLSAMGTWPKYGIMPDGRFIMLNKDTENDYVPYVHYEDMLKVVNGMPTADVAPVIHSHWVTLQSGMDCICNNCSHYWIPKDEKYDFTYCPNCGAKMDEVIT